MAMVIVAVSDLHGELSWLPAALDRIRPQLLLCAGDWGDPGQLREQEFMLLLERAHVLSVYGNHDDRPLLARLKNADGTPVLLAQGETRRVLGLTVAGISGIWAKTKLGSRLNRQWEAARRRKPTLVLDEWLAGRELPPYVTDEEVEALAARIAGQEIDILVTHACPAGWGDRTPGGGHGGQRCFRQASAAIRPSIHLCGHLHRLQRSDLPDGSAVLNTGHGAMREGWQIRWDDGRWDASPLEIP
ncbi:MAG TPA: hypothetical protein GX715_07925 [Armatimonadetes bacterium]|nr:hypothetical protein [Armatimonadota bacterium]